MSETIQDRQTEDYFDQYTPHFNQAKFGFALDYLAEHATEDQSVVDIGCSDGGTLALIRENTPLRNLAGFDVARAYVEKAAAATGCEPIAGSILDPEMVARHADRFDYAVLGAVLHHLIDGTRTRSTAAADLCVKHTFELLKPGGQLILFEPTFRPRVAMWGVFWIKRILGSFISSRLELGRAWLNIAQPVVSYYSDHQIDGMIARHGGEIVKSVSVDRGRIGVVLERHGIGRIIRKRANA